MRPPVIARMLLLMANRKRDADAVLGDFEEFYRETSEEKGAFHAYLWYWRQAIVSIPFIVRSIFYWGAVMFTSYCRTAFRSCMKQKAFTFIILSGLAFGQAAFIFSLSYALFKFDFDMFHEKADRIYSVVQVEETENTGEQHSAFVSGQLLKSLKDHNPEITEGARFYQPGNIVFRNDNNLFNENRTSFVDPSFLDIFDFEFISGNPGEALTEKNSIVLKSSLALKYFGDEDPVGKFLTLNSDTEVRVTGVLKDTPRHSSIRFTSLVTYETAEVMFELTDDRDRNDLTAFIVLASSLDKSVVEAKLPSFTDTWFPDKESAPEKMYLLPLKDWHLNSMHINSIFFNNSPAEIYLALMVGIAFLLVVCLNFTNITIARSMSRGMEVGIRKVSGAFRTQLVNQFLTESVLLSVLAIPFAVLIYEGFFLPAFLDYVGVTLEMESFRFPVLYVYLFSIVILTGLVSGSYPALYLAKFNPSVIFKGGLRSGRKSGRIRKTLVVAQFALAVFLIIFAVSLREQFEHIWKADFGYDRENVIIIELVDEALQERQNLKTEMLRNTAIISAGSAAGNPVRWYTESPVIPEGYSENMSAWSFDRHSVGYGFIETLNVRLTQGRLFSEMYNDENSFIINEFAVEKLDWDDPLGKELTVSGKTGTIIGIVENYYFKDVHFALSPSVLTLEPENVNLLYLKSAFAVDENLIDTLKETWQQIVPNAPFEYSLLSGELDDNYNGILRTSNLFGFIALLTIIFSCLGLFGLAAYSVERRTREVGIRKALGANSGELVMMLMKEFLLLVLIANLVIAPVAYFTVNSLFSWGWVFHVEINPLLFLVTAGLTVLVAALSVFTRTYRAANTNPAESLKYE